MNTTNRIALGISLVVVSLIGVKVGADWFSIKYDAVTPPTLDQVEDFPNRIDESCSPQIVVELLTAQRFLSSERVKQIADQMLKDTKSAIRQQTEALTNLLLIEAVTARADLEVAKAERDAAVNDINRPALLPFLVEGPGGIFLFLIHSHLLNNPTLVLDSYVNGGWVYKVEEEW